MRKKTGTTKYLFVFVLLLFCYYMYSIYQIYSFELIPDEFGYWTYAATLSGCDWSDIVSLGSYYSFGYTLILYTIFQIFQDSIVAYRAAVTVNFLLMILAYFVLLKNIMRLQEERQKTISLILITGIAILYPSWLHYSRSTMTEIVVMSMYIIICMLMTLYLDNHKPGILVALIISLIYIYTVHMRTVAILIAAVITLGIYAFMHIGNSTKNWIKIAAVIIALALLFMIADRIKAYITQNIYTDTAKEVIAYNDYNGQTAKIKGIFTLTGFRNLLISAICKLWYLGLASFGLFYWGVYVCFKRLWQQKKLIYLFILLATAGEIAVTAIYTTGIGGRIDGLTYGRYNEQILPILMVLGCIGVMENRHIVKPALCIAILQLPVLGLIIYIIDKYHQTNIHAYMILGISYLYNGADFNPATFHIMAYIVSMILMIFVIFILRISNSRKLPVLVAIIMAMELFLGIHLAATFSSATQMANFRDMQLIDIAEKEMEHHDRLVYIQEGDRCLADNLQFRLRNTKIYLIYDKKDIAENDLVITDYLYSGLDELKNQYTYWRVMGHLAIFYNE